VTSSLSTNASIAAIAAAVAAIVAPFTQAVGPGRDLQAIEVVAPDAPANKVAIVEGQAFTVPAGMFFVTQAMGVREYAYLGNAGSPGRNLRTTLSANSTVVLSHVHGHNNGQGSSLTEVLSEVPGQPVFGAGTLLEVNCDDASGSVLQPSPIGVVFGYLADA
jgi:hypothetical protein